MANKAAKATKARNPNRTNGKAWSKNHEAPVKALTKEQQERKAHKAAERGRTKYIGHERGSSITMPRITWEWATQTVAGRLTSTRRFRMVEACLAQERRGN